MAALAFFSTHYREVDPETGNILSELDVYSPVFDDGISCVQAETAYRNITPDQARSLRANCTTTAPDAPTGFAVTPRNCGGFDVIVTDLGGVNDAPVSAVTKTAVVTSNPDLFTTTVDWQAGKARISMVPTGAIPSGQSLRYWIGGMGYQTTLPEYVFSPGDNVQIMAVVSDSPYVFQGAEWTQKANVLITIGPEPSQLNTEPNVALASAYGTTASASSTYSGYPASFAIDGDRTSSTGIWNQIDGQSSVGQWLMVDLKQLRLLQRIVLYCFQDGSGTAEPTNTMTFSQYGITAFQVQISADGATNWTSVATVTGNNLVKRTVTFSPVSTRYVRILVDATSDIFARIVELQAFLTA